MKKSNLTDKELAKLLKTAGERFKLSTSDRGILKAELIDVIKSGAVRTSKQSQISHIFNQRRFAMPLIPIIIAALIAIGGGTAAIADSAKPGDALYPIDQWVERIQERLIWTDEAKAGWFARLSEERVEELQALLEMDPEQLQEEARERWEMHRQNATGRVAASAERMEAVMERFEEKLANAEDEDQKAVFTKVIDRIEEITARRELHLDEMEGKEFPGIGRIPVRQMMRTWGREHSAEMDEMREQMMEEFGGAMPAIFDPNDNDADDDGIPDDQDPNPSWPPHIMIAEDPFPPRFDVPVPSPEEITALQRQWQEMQDQFREEAARWLGTDTEDNESDEFEVYDPPVPRPELMSSI